MTARSAARRVAAESDLPIYVGGAVALAAIGWFLVADIGRMGGGRRGGAEVIAKVERVENSVRSRPAAVPSWDQVSTGQDLRQRDQVYAGAGSLTEVALKDGSRVTVNENTLVVLEMEADSAALEIRHGIVYVVSGKDQKDVTFKVNGVRGIVKSGHSEAVVNVAPSGVASITVVKGLAELTTPTGKTAVGAREVTKVDKDGAVAAPKPMALMLEAPAWDASLFVPEDARTPFIWSASTTLTELDLEIAADPDFAEVLRTVRVKGTRTVLESPPLGRYFWRVTGLPRDATERVASDVRAVNFLTTAPPRIVRPRPSELYAYSGANRPRVTFDWRAAAAEGFDLEINGTQGLGFRRLTSKEPPLLVDGLADGNYQVRIRSRFRLGRTSAWSEPVDFRVGPLGRPEVPSSLTPRDRTTFAKTGDAWPEVVFRASGAGSLTRIDVDISTDETFVGEVQKVAGKTLTARWTPPAEGTFFWRARVTDVDGQVSDSSPTRRFDVTATPPLSPPALQDDDLTIQWGEDSGSILPRWMMPVAYAAPATGGRVNVTWPSVPGASRSHLQIARDASFARVVVDERVDEARFVWRDPEIGRYFYRVAAVDADGRESAYAKVATLNVKYPTPELLAPRDGTSVKDGVDVDFRWKGLPSIDRYRVQVATTLSFTRPVIDQETGAGALRVKVPAGSFVWRVVAIDGDGAQVVSPTRRLTVEAPVVRGAGIVLVAPEDGARLDSAVGPTAFTWKADRPFDAFDVEIKPGGPGKETSLRVTTPVASVALQPGPYAWRVRGRTQAEASAWSDVRSFQVVKTEPAPAPALTAPAPPEPAPDGRSFLALGGAVATVDAKYTAARAIRRVDGTAERAGVAEVQLWPARWLGVGVHARGHSIVTDDHELNRWSGGLDLGGGLDVASANLRFNPYVGYGSSDLILYERATDATVTEIRPVRATHGVAGLRIFWHWRRLSVRLGGEAAQPLDSSELVVDGPSHVGGSFLAHLWITRGLAVGLIYVDTRQSYDAIRRKDVDEGDAGELTETVSYAGGLLSWLM